MGAGAPNESQMGARGPGEIAISMGARGPGEIAPIGLPSAVSSAGAGQRSGTDSSESPNKEVWNRLPSLFGDVLT